MIVGSSLKFVSLPWYQEKRGKERKKEREKEKLSPIRLNLIQVATKTVFDLSRKWRKKSIYYESLEISKAWLKNAYF